MYIYYRIPFFVEQVLVFIPLTDCQLNETVSNRHSPDNRLDKQNSLRTVDLYTDNQNQIAVDHRN